MAKIIDASAFTAGNGVADDTLGLQAAFDAASRITQSGSQGGRLILNPPVTYRTTAPIIVQPWPGQTQGRLQVDGIGAVIDYNGPPGTPAIASVGLKDPCWIRGLSINLRTPSTIGWELRTTAAISSSSFVEWDHCSITFVAPGCTAWRSVPGPGGIGDCATFRWNQSAVRGNGNGGIGWHNNTTNSMPWAIRDSAVGGVDVAYLVGSPAWLLAAPCNVTDTTIALDNALLAPATGKVMVDAETISYTGLSGTALTGCIRGVDGTIPAAHVATSVVTLSPGWKGSADLIWDGGGGGHNQIDFWLQNGGPHRLGGRWEKGKRFLQAAVGASGFPMPIEVVSLTLAEYTPADGVLFMLKTAVQLALRGLNVYGLQVFDSRMITAAAGQPGFGSVLIEGGAYVATNPCWTIPDLNWPVVCQGAARMAGGHAVGYLTGR